MHRRDVQYILPDIAGAAESMGAEVLGKLPYDNVTTRAMIAGKTVVEFSDGEFSSRLDKIWQNILAMLD